MTAGSAHWIAAVRARESERSDRLFDDPYARQLAGELGFAAMAASERVTGENNFVPVRVRWFDDAILAAVGAGIRQVVLLGAGLDTRPYRLDIPADSAWYEVDLAEPLAHKKSVLGGRPARCRCTAVVADLTGDWRSPLDAAGFDSSAATLWIAEGLFFYLFPSAVSALLRLCAASGGAGSIFLADVMGTAGLTGEAMRPYRERQAAIGGPPPFGTADPAGLFAEAGWGEVTLTAPGGPGANFGRLPKLPEGQIAGAPHLVNARPGTATGGR